MLFLDVSSSLPATVFMVEPTEFIARKNLFLARAIVIPTNGKIICRLLNVTNSPIALKQHSAVGTLQSLDSDEILSMDESDGKPNPSKINNTPAKFAKPTPDAEIVKKLGVTISTDLTPSQKQEMTSFLSKNSDVFATSLKQLGKAKIPPHHIDTGTAPPIRCRSYRHPPEIKKEIDKQVQEMLDNDIIEQSTSLWQSPVVIVPKRTPDNTKSYRFCVDYRKLNKVTRSIHYSLPLFNSMIDDISQGIQSKFSEGRAAYFSSLDLRSGFWHQSLTPESKEKSSFTCHLGCFQFKRLPFGLKNSPLAFASAISSVMAGLETKFLSVFIDEFFIFSPDYSTHLDHLSQVFTRLRNANLTLHPSKCTFGAQTIKFLGFIVSKNGLQPDPKKVEAIRTFPAPSNQKQLRSFLGIVNFYRRFLTSFSQTCFPLTQLLRKDAKWHWSSECDQAFNTLRTALMTAPILALPDFSKQFVLSTDASSTALAYVLQQEDSQHRLRVIAYGGRGLRPAETNFTTTEIEMLALVTGVREFNVYLAHKPFIVYSDHIALRYIDNLKTSQGRLLRWSLLLQPYDFTVIHKPGKLHLVPDGLSRREYPPEPEPLSIPSTVETDDDLMSILLDDVDTPMSSITPQTTDPPTPYQIQIEYGESAASCDYTEADLDLLCHSAVDICSIDNLPDLQRACSEFSDIITYLETQELPENEKLARRVLLQSEQFVIGTDNLLYHLYQPRTKNLDRLKSVIRQVAIPPSMRADILHSFHDENFAGAHLGIDRVYMSIRMRYFWFGLYRDVVNHVTTCVKCQKCKRYVHARRAPLAPLPCTDEPFQRLHIDFLKMSESTSGYKYILLIVDSFSRWPEAFPTRSQDATIVADILYSQIFCRYGCARILVSDQGQSFLSHLVAELCKKFHVTRAVTSPYHPATNSSTERMNSALLNAFRTYTHSQSSWDTLLPGILAAYRATVSTHSTQCSPFSMLFGKEMVLPLDVSLTSPQHATADVKQYVSDLNKTLRITADIARENASLQQEQNKLTYDKTAVYPKFQVNDIVLLSEPHVPLGSSPKLFPKFRSSLYRITRLGPNFTYALHDCNTNTPLKTLIHANRLRPYKSRVNPISMPVTQATFTPTTSSTSADQAQQSVTLPQSDINADIVTPPTLTDTSAVSSQTDPSASFDVERLLRMPLRNGRKEYLVKWLNSGPPTWQPVDNISEPLLEAFHTTYTQTGSLRRRKRT
jgi:transposase InsO family protein